MNGSLAMNSRTVLWIWALLAQLLDNIEKGVMEDGVMHFD